jgi:hypothetical protein
MDGRRHLCFSERLKDLPFCPPDFHHGNAVLLQLCLRKARVRDLSQAGAEYLEDD